MSFKTPDPAIVSSRKAQEPIQAHDVSIVVPVGGNAAEWERCLSSLCRLDPSPGEIIVVLDGPDVIEGRLAAAVGVTFLSLDQQAGPAVARNLGASKARGALLFFVDSDIELPPDTITGLLCHFGADSQHVAVIGSYDDDPGAENFLSQYRNLLHHFVHQNAKSEASTFWGACGAIYRETFCAIGGFDERFSMPSVEDIELGRRLWRSGHTIRLAKEFQVKHLKTWRLWNLVTTDLFRRAIPWTELMLREGQLTNDLNSKTKDRICVALAWLMLVASVVAWWWLPILVGIPAAALLLVVVNADLFRFFARRRGVRFAFASLMWYWFYLLICGLGFIVGVTRQYLGRSFRSSA